MSDDVQPASKGPSFINRVAVVGFMGLIVLGESALAYFWIPSAADVLKKTEEKVASQTKEKSADEEDLPANAPAESVVEVELGQFGITAHQPAAGSTLRVDFTLVGTVQEKDRSEFASLLERNRHRFRDMVLVEIRTAEVADLTDPGLGLIKRRILEKSNTLFGKPILRSVFFSDYTFLDE